MEHQLVRHEHSHVEIDVAAMAARLDRTDFLLLREFYHSGRPYPHNTQSHVLRLLVDKLQRNSGLGGKRFSYGGIRRRLENLVVLGLLVDIQKETGHVYNLEATSAEGAAYRLARLDKATYPEIKTASTGTPHYTNSSQLPVGYSDDIFEVLELQDELQSLYTGGTVLHLYLGECIDDTTVVKRLIQYSHTLSYPSHHFPNLHNNTRPHTHQPRWVTMYLSVPRNRAICT